MRCGSLALVERQKRSFALHGQDALEIAGMTCSLPAVVGTNATTPDVTPSDLENLMSSVKDTMREIIAQQPDDSTYDEILRELAYARMVRRGLEDSDAGRTVSDDDARKRIESWRK